MSLRWLGVSFAFTFSLAAQPAAANQDVACPEGQAIRAIGDKTAVCVPVPPPANLAPLNAAINAEAVARMAADQELRDSIGGETGLRGQYSFTGTAQCLASSTGFADNLLPLISPPPAPSTLLTQSSNTISGVRTFNGDGTGTVVAIVHNIQTSGPTVSTLHGTFTYELGLDRTLIIDDAPTQGLITKGGIRVGWKTTTLNVPRFVGVVSKDLRTVSVTHEDMVVEQSIL